MDNSTAGWGLNLPPFFLAVAVCAWPDCDVDVWGCCDLPWSCDTGFGEDNAGVQRLGEEESGGWDAHCGIFWVVGEGGLESWCLGLGRGRVGYGWV